MVKAIVGACWGDEGKGKITDVLAGRFRHRGAVPGRQQRRAYDYQRVRKVRPASVAFRRVPSDTSPTSLATAWLFPWRISSKRSSRWWTGAFPCRKLLVSDRGTGGHALPHGVRRLWRRSGWRPSPLAPPSPASPRSIRISTPRSASRSATCLTIRSPSWRRWTMCWS